MTFDPIEYAKEIGEGFKLGSGVLGKSAIAVGILMVVGGIAVYRLHSDKAILVALLMLAVIFLAWFFPVMRFVDKHPDAALLEGAEWTGWQRFQASAKGFLSDPSSTTIIVAPGTSEQPPTGSRSNTEPNK